jgi:hypothetical protein
VLVDAKVGPAVANVNERLTCLEEENAKLEREKAELTQKVKEMQQSAADLENSAGEAKLSEQASKNKRVPKQLSAHAEFLHTWSKISGHLPNRKIGRRFHRTPHQPKNTNASNSVPLELVYLLRCGYF